MSFQRMHVSVIGDLAQLGINDMITKLTGGIQLLRIRTDRIVTVISLGPINLALVVILGTRCEYTFLIRYMLVCFLICSSPYRFTCDGLYHRIYFAE